MLKRFSLYGFLKNQRYFEPFLILYYLHLELSYTQIGILVGLSQLFVNLAEIPSGAAADILGRKKSLIFSFSSYILSFVIFANAHSFYTLIPAVLLFAIGDAFRTGTHKSLIFTWLRINDRTDEKSKIYGFTRSWSKLGSAFSVIIATILLFVTEDYSIVFYCSIIPYVLGIINFLGYPGELEGEKINSDSKDDNKLKTIVIHLKDSLVASFTTKGIRSLIIESMSFEGVFKSVKDYVQPVIKTMMITIPLSISLTQEKKTFLLTGIVYFILAIFSATASRNAYRIVNKSGSEKKASQIVWRSGFFIYGIMGVAAYFEDYYLVIALFLVLNVLQNIFRPLLISRFDDHSDENKGATILSIESQAKTISTMIFAPLTGWIIDLTIHNNIGGKFWPIGVIGAIMSLFVITFINKGKK